MSGGDGKGGAGIAAFVAPFALIVAGCVANNWVLELIVSKKCNPWADPGAGGMLTLLQFAFISAANLRHVVVWRQPEKMGRAGGSTAALPGSGRQVVWTYRIAHALPFYFKPTRIPLREYAYMTALFAAMSLLNNAAFAYHISQPLHMVFRSANMVTTYIMGNLVFGRKYTRWQLACVVVLTLGALLATVAEAVVGDTAKAAMSSTPPACKGGGCADAPGPSVPRVLSNGGGASPTTTTASAAYLWTWGMGIAILFAVLMLQTVLGNHQNHVSVRYGKAPSESMFYQHTLALPLFLLLLPDLIARARLWSTSPSLYALATTPAAGHTAAGSAVLASPGQVLGMAHPSPLAPVTTMPMTLVSVLSAVPLLRSLPIMWLYIIINVVSQYGCIAGVYQLTPIAEPLTLNVVLTVRKFISLLLSIYLFNNTFTLFHWVGAATVFGGALVYSMAPAPSSPPRAGLGEARHAAVADGGDAHRHQPHVHAGGTARPGAGNGGIIQRAGVLVPGAAAVVTRVEREAREEEGDVERCPGRKEAPPPLAPVSMPTWSRPGWWAR